MTTLTNQFATVELAYDARPINYGQNIVWTDVTADTRSASTRRGRSNELQSMTTGSATVVLDNRARTYDPVNGGSAPGAWYPGVIGDRIYAADGLSAGLTEFDIRVVLAPRKWTVDWRSQALVSQWDAAGEGSFLFGLLSQNTTSYGDAGLFVEGYDGSSNYYYADTATNAPPADDGSIYAVRVTWRSSDGRIQFFTKSTTISTYKADADADTSWVQLGSNGTGPTAALVNSNEPIDIGYVSYAPEWFSQGAFYYVSIAETIDGAAAMSMDMADYVSGTTLSSGGDTWTIQPGTDFSTLRIVSETNAGKLRPRTPIRISSTAGTGTDRIFTGHVSRITQGYDVNGDAIVTLDCSDEFALLSSTELPGSESTVRALTLADAYGAPAGIGFELDTVGRYHYPFTSDVYRPACILETFGDISAGDQIVPYGPETSIYFNGGLGLGLVPFSVVDGTTDVSATMSVWFRTSTKGAAFQPRIITASPARSGTSAPWLGINENGYIQFVTSAGGTGTVEIDVTDGEAHHLAFANRGSSVLIWLDGNRVFRKTGLSTFWMLDFQNAWALGAAWNWVPLALGFVGEMSHFVHFSSTLGTDAAHDAAILELYNAGKYGTYETTSERLTAVLDAIDWPAGRRDIDTGYGQCAGNTYDENDDALTVIKIIADTEQGLAFMSKAGDVTFRARYWQTLDTTGSTSQATFSSDGAVGAIPYRAMSFGTDGETVLYNDVTVTSRAAGVEARFRDEASIEQFGHSPRTVTTILDSSDACLSMAKNMVNRWAQPLVRVQPFGVRPETEAQLETICGLELGDRITVELNPPGGGSQAVHSITIDSIAHSITQGQVWDITLSGSPVDPFTYFVLDVSELDSTHVLGY